MAGFRESVDRVNDVNRITVNKALIMEWFVEWKRGKEKNNLNQHDEVFLTTKQLQGHCL